MKAKVGIAFAFSLVLVLLIVGSAAAIKVVSYTDMGGDYFFESEQGDASLVANGDFEAWTDGRPDSWAVWPEDDATKPSGWEDWHLAQTDLSANNDGSNYAMGMFVRNIGGSGSYYVGAKQPLEQITESGYYWVTVHATMFGEYDFFTADNSLWLLSDNLANAFAWYGISAEEDPANVDDWREMFLVNAVPGGAPCPNPWEGCIYVGRYETVWIDAGDTMHLMAGHKFPSYNVWTLFTFDDISIVPLTDDFVDDGLFDDGDQTWEQHTIR